MFLLGCTSKSSGVRIMSHQIGRLEATFSAALQCRFTLGGGRTLIVGRMTVLQVALESPGVRRHVATQRAAMFEVLRHVAQVQRPRRPCRQQPADVTYMTD